MSRLIDLETKEADIMISEVRDRFGDFVAVKCKELLGELPEAQRWIPVTERLPELHKAYTDADGFCERPDGLYEAVGGFSGFESLPVLVCGYFEGEMLITGAIYCEWRYEDGRKNETEWRDNLGGELEIKNVIAWMPMPEPYEGDLDEHID